jgi:hypothetical protein
MGRSEPKSGPIPSPEARQIAQPQHNSSQAEAFFRSLSSRALIKSRTPALLQSLSQKASRLLFPNFSQGRDLCSHLAFEMWDATTFIFLFLSNEQTSG